MAESGEQQSARSDFTSSVLGPVCDHFAETVGADSPMPWNADGKSGFEVELPGDRAGKSMSAIVATEPKDNEAFGVSVSRPDEPSMLREVALVRYDELSGSDRKDAGNRVSGLVQNALNTLRQSLASRGTSPQ